MIYCVHRNYDMNKEYTKLVQSIELSSINLVESHEQVVFFPTDEQLAKVKIDTEHEYNKEDPVIKDSNLLNNHKYRFLFSVDEKQYFIAEYIIFISFNIKKLDEVERLLKIDEIKKLFIEKQIDRLVWSYLRGVVLDAFNKHSLKPIPLPLLC